MAEKGCEAEPLRDWPKWGADWQPGLITGLVVILIGIALLLLVPEAEATEPSPVTLLTDSDSKYVLDGERVYFAISIANTDDENNVTVQMNGTFLSGSDWDSEFVADLDDRPLPEVKSPGNVTLPKGIVIPSLENATVYFWVEAPLDAHNSSPRRIEIRAPLMGYNESGWHEIHENWSRIILTVTTVKEYDVKVTLDQISQAGNINLYQAESTLWGFTLQNRGWNEDTYNLTGRAYKNGSPGPETGWAFTFAPGNSVTLAGLGPPQAFQPLQSQFTVTPPAEALPGEYRLEVLVVGSYPNSTATTAARADATIPLPDFVIQPGDVVFSHSSACVPCMVDGIQQSVTIFATVRNDGGNRDDAGRATRNVDVTFTVLDADDLSPAGKVNGTGSNSDTFFVPSLNHGEELTVEIKFTPNPIGYGEATLLIQVNIDEDNSGESDFNIGESNANNNSVSETLKVIQPSGHGGYPWPVCGQSIKSEIAENWRGKGISELQLSMFITMFFLLGLGLFFKRAFEHLNYEADEELLVNIVPLPLWIKIELTLAKPHNFRAFASIILVLVTSLASIQYIGSAATDDECRYDPIGTFRVDKIENNIWTVQIERASSTISLYYAFYQLYDLNDTLVTSGNVMDIYGFFIGNGRGIVFTDNDFNTRINTGDMFTVHGGEKGDADLESIDDLTGYRFRLVWRYFGEEHPLFYDAVFTTEE